MIEGAPLPDPNDPDAAPFWEGTAAGELRVQRCTSCSTWRFPPRPMCPSCRSTEVEWVAVSGRGTVWSYVVAHPPLLPAFAPVAPYPVVVVELAEHPNLRMVGNVVSEAGAAINSVDPAALVIGATVRVAFDQVAEDVTMPRWVLQ